MSIATNLAECNGRFTRSDRKNFFTIARASAQERVPLLELATRKNLLLDESHQVFRKQIEEIAKMFSGLISGMDKRQA